MILFAPGPPAPPLHYSHRAVRMLDRVIRFEQVPRLEVDPISGNSDGSGKSITLHYSAILFDLQLVRKALAGKPLRAYLRTGKRSKQRRLAL